MSILSQIFFLDIPAEMQQVLLPFMGWINLGFILIWLVLIYLTHKKPVLANALIIILLPTYLVRGQIGLLPFTFLEICLLIVFLIWLIKSLVTYNSQLITYNFPFKWLILLILVAATISIFTSSDLRTAAGLWKAYFVEPVLFFIVLINTNKTKRDFNIILWSLGISTLSISLLAIWQKFTGWGIAEVIWQPESARRVTGFFTSPNAVGLYLGPIIAIYFGWLLNDIKKFSKNFHASQWGSICFILKSLILATAITTVIFTVSQGTWLGLAAALIFISFFGLSKKWTTVMVIILLILTFLIPISRNYLLPQITFQDPAGQNRLLLWQGSWQYLTASAKNFIFGAGIFGFPQVQEQFRDPLKLEPLIYPHNIILNFWFELGLIGLIAFAWLIISFFRKGFKKLYEGDFGQSRLLVLGIMAAMVAILIHGLIDVPYFKNDLSVLFWVIVSLLAINKSELRD